MSSFSPSVVVDGRVVQPPGFFYIIALAMNQDPWALEEVKKPEFDTMVKGWMKERKLHGLQQEADALQRQLDQINTKIVAVKSDQMVDSLPSYSRIRS